jgi:myo-inositol-1(or 4)-monophosphatase
MEFAPHIQQIAREAGRLLMKHFGKVDIEYKGDVDVVTVADRESEKLIVDRITSKWPNHDIVGEEGTRRSRGSEYRWYIDPLDGTTNFAHSFPVFCVSIALEYRDELIAGVVYDPTRDECFAAEKGAGATLNGHTMRVSNVSDFAQSLVATGFPSQKRHKNPNIHFYQHITLKTHGVRRAGSAAIDLAYTACGRFDAYWEFNLNPWDTAAGVLLVREAGGNVTDMDGRAFDIASKEVVASNAKLHPALIKELQAVARGEGLEDLPDVVEFGRTRSF